MKLFYKAGACSLAPHIVMAELNMVYELESVDLKTKVCASGDYRKINPKGSVPAIVMENGEILTEVAIIVQYLADQKSDSALLPKYGTTERYRCLEWLNFIATDLHKNYSPLFYAGMIVKSAEAQGELRSFFTNLVKDKIAITAERLGDREYVLGNQFTVADAYLFNVLGWGKYVGIDLSSWPNLINYMKRVGERPAVIRAMKEEGLI